MRPLFILLLVRLFYVTYIVAPQSEIPDWMMYDFVNPDMAEEGRDVCLDVSDVQPQQKVNQMMLADQFNDFGSVLVSDGPDVANFGDIDELDAGSKKLTEKNVRFWVKIRQENAGPKKKPATIRKNLEDWIKNGRVGGFVFDRALPVESQKILTENLRQWCRDEFKSRESNIYEQKKKDKMKKCALVIHENSDKANAEDLTYTGRLINDSFSKAVQDALKADISVLGGLHEGFGKENGRHFNWANHLVVNQIKSVDYKDESQHKIALAFYLLWTYGFPMVSNYVSEPAPHKMWGQLLTLVKLRKLAGNAPVTRIYQNTNVLGFAREKNLYFIANNSAKPVVVEIDTGLPAGSYENQLDVSNKQPIVVQEKAKTKINVPAKTVLVYAANTHNEVKPAANDRWPLTVIIYKVKPETFPGENLFLRASFSQDKTQCAIHGTHKDKAGQSCTIPFAYHPIQLSFINAAVESWQVNNTEFSWEKPDPTKVGTDSGDLPLGVPLLWASSDGKHPLGLEGLQAVRGAGKSVWIGLFNINCVQNTTSIYFKALLNSWRTQGNNSWEEGVDHEIKCGQKVLVEWDTEKHTSTSPKVLEFSEYAEILNNANNQYMTIKAELMKESTKKAKKANKG